MRVNALEGLVLLGFVIFLLVLFIFGQLVSQEQTIEELKREYKQDTTYAAPVRSSYSPPMKNTRLNYTGKKFPEHVWYNVNSNELFVSALGPQHQVDFETLIYIGEF
jgi:hypothetical protein